MSELEMIKLQEIIDFIEHVKKNLEIEQECSQDNNLRKIIIKISKKLEKIKNDIEKLGKQE